MPRKGVPFRVDEIADAIIKSMKKRKKKLSEDKMYDIAYGTAWNQYYKEKKNKKSKSAQEIYDNLKLAQMLDDLNLFHMADQLDQI